MADRGDTPRGFSAGIVTLIFKKGNKKDIKNYRPISLLNVDYKIMAKIIANRLKEVAGDVVTSLQAYGVPGRDISDSILTIQGVVRGMREEGGYLLSLDLEKAFDRVDHSFLFKLLRRVGFGQSIVKIIKLLYSGASSRLKLNGRLTGGFDIKRSVRQGCPLSPLLFSFFIEALAAAVTADHRLPGLRVSPGLTKALRFWTTHTHTMDNPVRTPKETHTDKHTTVTGAPGHLDITQHLTTRTQNSTRKHHLENAHTGTFQDIGQRG